MTILLSTLLALLALVPSQATPAAEGALWDAATPFATFLENVKARRDQWDSRFANAAIDADALTRLRALPGRRRLLAVAEARCSDSAWAVPYLAKLATAAPDKLEVRVIPPADGHRIQSANLTPDGRMATPTIAILDDQNQILGVWVERPAELQKWYVANMATVATDERYSYVNKWYTEDAGRTTIREVLAILERTAPAAPKAALAAEGI
jgi:hypothetical protein